MIVFLIDADNLSSAAWIEEACTSLESSEGSLSVRRAYGSAENLKGLSQTMLAWAIRPFVNLSLTKNTTDVALAVDAMELACQSPKPTVIAIGSGDADFVPLVVRLRERGIRMICVSERTKMASEAVHAYDSVLFVGKEMVKGRAKEEVPVAVRKTPAKKSVAKKAPSTSVAEPATTKVASKKAQPAERSKDGSHLGGNLAGCAGVGSRTDPATRRHRQTTARRKVDWQECGVDQTIQEIPGPF